jgi:hypothetical protein
MKFKEFLRKKLVVFTFGRMNPFTFGHYHLAQVLDKTANKFSTSYKSRIYLSHTQNSTKDPLSYDDKIKYAKDALIYYEQIQVTKSKARTVIEVAKELESEGFTDIVLVVGSDRVREFKSLLEKYNGKDYTFNSIKVVSAGERDPDAEGVAGFSASKVRAMAVQGDLEGFKKAVPYLPKTAEELYNKIRKGLKINEDLDLDFEELLTEGVHDKGIFKAVFLAGGPGSGKDYVLSNTLDGHGLVEINSDKALEFLMDKKRLDKTMPDAEKASRNQVRGRAKDITELKQRLALQGRNGLIINGTGDDVEKITRIKKSLENLGYETSMLMVNTSDEVSAARNIERGQRGGRTVPETIRKQKWDSAQNGRTEYAKMFGANYMEFDNSEDLREADPDTVKSKKMEMLQLFKNVQQFISTPPKNPKAEEWVAQELEKKDTYRVPKSGVEQVPPSDDSASDEARKLGLKYYGFGRYGVNGEVTYRSVHGKLVPVKKDVKESIDDEFTDFISEDLRKWFDKDHPEGGWKRINSKGEAIGPCAREPGEPKPKCMSNEKRASLSKKERASAVAVKRKHDPNPERKGKPINVSNFGKGKLSESFDLSDSSALNLLLLGTEIDEHDLPIGEEKDVKLLKDKAGRVRIFMLRAAAAREAHTHDGLVLKYKNGYVIQLKENENVNEINSKNFWNARNQSRETSFGWSSEGINGEGQQILGGSTGYSSGTKTLISEQSDNRFGDTNKRPINTKITLAEIRTKKEKLQEEKQQFRETITESTQIDEIDRGIEPGLSMAASGENMGRGTLKVKQIKKPLEELTGDETTASISAQVEDGLKKKGMDLKTFRSKRPIG